jgi:hypothetical protein
MLILKIYLRTSTTQLLRFVKIYNEEIKFDSMCITKKSVNYEYSKKEGRNLQVHQ